MLKKSFIILLLLITLPAFSAYNPLSDEPIESVEQFYSDDEEELTSPEFEYTAGENKPKVEEATEAEKKDGSTEAKQEEIIIPEQKEVKKDYAGIYNSLEPAKHSYMHDIDPDQYYDMKDATWAPYPLLRLNSYIYFKNISIEPGYYLLTPREHKGKWYLLFKQNGKVAHIIPIYERDITPEFFYEKHLPKPKLTKAQKIHMGTLSFLGKFKSTKRKDPIKCYMEITDLENHFVSIIIYYGNHKYSTIFRTIKL